MPIDGRKLTGALEAVVSQEKPESVSLAASVAAELVGAQEFGLLTIELHHEADIVSVRNVVIHAGALGSEIMNRQVHQRARWWERNLSDTTRTMVPRLLQSDPDFASDAFRFAGEPLINPKLSALCIFEKTAPGLMNAAIAADMSHVPSVLEQLVFQSLAGLLLGSQRSAMSDTSRFSLSAREKECLEWIARGKTSFEIAQITNLSMHTVNHYLANSLTKLNASNRVHAVVKAVALGVISLDDI
ncbi:MAG: helix-turn-helix transcriptional regulator [Rhizobiaceae bacterium]